MARGGRPSIPKWRPSALKSLVQESDESPAWLPDIRFTIRLLLIARVVAALHSNISDCDETFNYWEPLHLLSHPPKPLGTSQAPFQTWEYVPEYAIRSWAYLLQYVPIASAVRWIGRDKAASFYAVRIFLAICSSVCEAHLVQSVAEHVSARAARYTLIMLLFSAGMFASSTALLPSTFAMYATTLASAYTMRPAVEGSDHFVINHSLPAASIRGRASIATLFFAAGALIAWPFALVISLPFVFEQLFMPGGLLVPAQRYGELVWTRMSNWVKSITFAAAIIGVPIILVDSIAYGRAALVPLQIVKYNILSARRGAGPTLYGTEPWYYYLLNLALNLGPALPLQLFSLPLVVVTAIYHPAAIVSGSSASVQQADKKKTEGSPSANNLSSSPFSLLIVRLLPAYIWLALLSTQPHKEERFVYPAYPLLYFNAAISLLCLRIWTKSFCKAILEKHQGGAATKRLARIFTSASLAITCIISVSRIIHTTSSYRAPIAILDHLSRHEIPRIVAYSLPEQQSSTVKARLIAGQSAVLSVEELQKVSWTDDRKNDPFVDIAQLKDIAKNRKESEVLRLCYGKEWYRFPTTYLVPDGVAVDFIKSDFAGILPKHFHRQDEKVDSARDGSFATAQRLFWPWRFATSARRIGFNDLNKEEADQYVDVSTCDYLVDSSRPQDDAELVSANEPDFARDSKSWTKVFCAPFLDTTSSRMVTGDSLIAKIHSTVDRTLWLPSWLRVKNNRRYGEYCLLRTSRTSSLANVAAPSLSA